MTDRRAVLSVAVIQFTSRAHLVRCLEALVAQRDVRPEIIVPHDDTFDDVASLRERFPAVRLLHVSGRRTPAALRSAAAAASTGRIVAFLEDHCVPDPDWAVRLLAAHAEPHAAVGGAVEKGFPPGRNGDTALNWAIYLTDYSRYMNPQTGGPVVSLTDCNVSYKRAELEAIRDVWATEFHENVVHAALAERGRTLWLAPDVIVREQRSITPTAAVRDRYAFGRLFGSTRVEGQPLVRRLAFAAGALAMPPVLVARVARNLMIRRRHRLQLFRCAPWLLVVTGVWMLGEAIGYLTATPPAALSGKVTGDTAAIHP